MRLLLTFALIVLLPMSAAATAELNLYSARHYDSDRALYKKFTEETGIKINVIEGKDDALIARLKAEGTTSPADVLLVSDLARLWRASQAGLFKAVQSTVLNERIPEAMQGTNGQWYGFTKRARVIIYNKAQGLPAPIDSYWDLAKPEFKGMVCTRPSSDVYSQSLLASMIAERGEEAAATWLKGFVGNFARPAQGNDSAQIEAVASGQTCKIALVNSYYIARYVDAENGVFESIAVIYPQGGLGTHMNVSGGGALVNAPNHAHAVQFLEYLASDQGQQAMSVGNNEYPASANLSTPPRLAAVNPNPDFKSDLKPASVLGPLYPTALRLADQAGWQ